MSENTFASVLGSILGNLGECRREEAAGRLSIHPRMLKRYLKGTSIPTQALIDGMNWRAAFAIYYPREWAVHKNAFEAAYSKLHISKRTSAKKEIPAVIAEPEVKSGLGHVIWSIIQTRPDLDGKQVAVKLGISISRLEAIIADECFSIGKISEAKKYAEVKKYADLFAQHFPRGWELYQTDYYLRFSQLPKSGASGPHKPRVPEKKTDPEEKWQKAAGGIFTRIRIQRGDDIGDVTKCMEDGEVKTNYPRLELGDTSFPLELYDAAAQEIQAVYNMGPHDPDWQQLTKLLDIQHANN